MYLCKILFTWSVLCPLSDNRYKKLCHSFTVFFGDEHLDEILSVSVIQSSLIMWGGLYEVGLGYGNEDINFLYKLNDRGLLFN
jgi:hypothetical protein